MPVLRKTLRQVARDSKRKTIKYRRNKNVLGFDDINCGGRLQVGTGIVPAIKEGDEKINGSMHAEGPAVFGGPTEFPDNFATLMVGRTKNDDKDCVPADRSLYVKGNTVIEGDDGTSSTLNILVVQDRQLILMTDLSGLMMRVKHILGQERVEKLYLLDS